MHSISTSTFLGRVLTATQDRAGFWVNHFSYSTFMSANRAMSARKMFTLTTRSSDEPAAVRTAFRFVMQAAVFTPMGPSTRLPWASLGICPEQ